MHKPSVVRVSQTEFELSDGQIFPHLAQLEEVPTVIGKNDQWKQSIHIGKRNNQNFVQILHARLIEMIRYKCQLEGIKVILNEESYSSKASALDFDPVPVYGSQVPQFSGRRVKRGLYKTASGKLINADINGSLNIIRKVFPNAFNAEGIVSPLRSKGSPQVEQVANPLGECCRCTIEGFAFMKSETEQISICSVSLKRFKGSLNLPIIINT